MFVHGGIPIVCRPGLDDEQPHVLRLVEVRGAKRCGVFSISVSRFYQGFIGLEWRLIHIQTNFVCVRFFGVFQQIILQKAGWSFYGNFNGAHRHDVFPCNCHEF